MIYAYYKTIRPPTVYKHTPHFPKNQPLVLGHVPNKDIPPRITDMSVSERNRAAHLKISNDEFARRDRIVKTASMNCFFQVGDTCFPIKKEDYERFGPCMIQFVARNYLDMGPSDKWPEHDNPMILTFSPLSDRQKRINCTTNFLSKTNIHLEIPTC